MNLYDFFLGKPLRVWWPVFAMPTEFKGGPASGLTVRLTLKTGDRVYIPIARSLTGYAMLGSETRLFPRAEYLVDRQHRKAYFQGIKDD